MSGPWSGSMYRIHIALQELQAVALMLCRMAFQLLGKVVALQPENSTTKAYLCNQGGTVLLFLSRPACDILKVANLHGITLIPAYLPMHSPGSFLTLGSTRGGSVGFLMYQSM